MRESEVLSTIPCRCICSRSMRPSATSLGIFPTPSMLRRRCFRCPFILSSRRINARASPMPFPNSCIARPSLAKLLPQHQQSQQEYPQTVHEVPVVRRDLCGHRARRFSRLERVQQHVYQRADSTQQVNTVRRRENIEKAARRICGYENPLRHELSPRNKLSDKEQDAERGGDLPELSETMRVACRQASPREFHRAAAGQ